MKKMRRRRDGFPIWAMEIKDFDSRATLAQVMLCHLLDVRYMETAAERMTREILVEGFYREGKQ